MNTLISLLKIQSYAQENQTTKNILDDAAGRVQSMLVLYDKLYLTHIDDIILNEKMLTPLGIILNELITNAMKYAFPGRDNGVIRISVSKNESRVKLIFEDNGIGIPESISLENPSGFGLQLLDMLVKQIQGSLTNSVLSSVHGATSNVVAGLVLLKVRVGVGGGGA